MKVIADNLLIWITAIMNVTLIAQIAVIHEIYDLLVANVYIFPPMTIIKFPIWLDGLTAKSLRTLYTTPRIISTSGGVDVIMQDLYLLRQLRQLSLPKDIIGLISMYANDVNVRAKERAGNIIKRLATSKVVGDNRSISDLIHATVYSTPDWAWNPHTDGSLMWRFSYRPTRMECEHALIEMGLDFSNCERHQYHRYCTEHCRNGRNLVRTGNFVRGLDEWYRCCIVVPE